MLTVMGVPFQWGFKSRETLQAERAHRSCSRTTALKSKRVWNSLTLVDCWGSASRLNMLMSMCQQLSREENSPHLTWRRSISCQAVASKACHLPASLRRFHSLKTQRNSSLLRDWGFQACAVDRVVKRPSWQLSCLDNNLTSIIVKIARDIQWS